MSYLTLMAISGRRLVICLDEPSDTVGDRRRGEVKSIKWSTRARSKQIDLSGSRLCKQHTSASLLRCCDGRMISENPNRAEY